MSAWRGLAERLVELDLAIEDRESWATAPEDIQELQRLEQLRDEIQAALAERRLSPHVRRLVAERGHNPGVGVTMDPRD
jgi:SPX domain protein involved in polyphosphate accumulation